MMTMELRISSELAASCRRRPERAEWLERLPGVVAELERRWQLKLGVTFDGDDATCSYVVEATRADGTPAVLKVGMPHMEGRDEIAALRFWRGEPTVRLLEADDASGAMLLERCEPGATLRQRAEPEQDEVIAGLLRRLWRKPKAPHAFRRLSALMKHWSDETLAQEKDWPDAGLVRGGLRLFEELPRDTHDQVLLATDLHAANVLRAEREPWLVIDPKPFVGERAYDATQHLFNCPERMKADADGTIQRFADLLGVESGRVRLWMFARAAAEPRDDWRHGVRIEMARAIAP